MAAVSSSAVSQVELKFEFFPKLPPELRRMIWKEALPGPRLVFLERLFISVPVSHRVWSNVDVNDEDNMFLREDRRYQLRSKSATPKTTYIRVKSQPSEQLRSLLQANLESRVLVKESYQLAFGREIYPPQTYFDFKQDTHLMYWDDFEDWHISDNRDNICVSIGQDIRKVDRLAVLACTPADVAAAYRRSNYPRYGGKIFGVWSTDQLWLLDPNTSLMGLDVRSGDYLFINFQEVQADSMALRAESHGEESDIRNSAKEIVPQDADGWFPDLDI
jgi:hypothetical protein